MVTETAMTWEQFLAAGEERQRWEYVDGEVEFRSPINLRHQMMIYRLIAYFVEYRKQHPEWLCVPGDAAFTVASGNRRCSDVSVVRAERFPDGRIPSSAGDFAPDIVFELLSAGDTAAQIQAKRKDYQESGVVQVWIDPDKRVLELIYPDRPLQYLQGDQPLVIDKLPDFSLNLKDIFSV
jgi:Uma2 family endonuclease